jgi:large subunit ribosomal protein L9
MRVILLKNVPGTGNKNDIKEVADGYARNFLIKKGLARPASDEAVKSIKQKEVKNKKKSERNLKDNQKKAEKIDGEEINVSGKVSENGVLYAAIKPEEIVKAVKQELKVDIQAKQVVFNKPIKEIGSRVVSIEFGHGIEAELNVVVSEK